MSEAIIIYRGRGGSVDPELLKPQTITNNGVYTAPVTGTYRVTCVGGGGGGGGGCRNAQNSSQVFYGSGGVKGAVDVRDINLNAGEQVTMTLGAGGAGGVNNATVSSNNSRGTNGSSGGTTSFGSYMSASGGTYGLWSWSYLSWNNTVLEYRWYMTSRGDNYKYYADLGKYTNSWLQVYYSVYNSSTAGPNGGTLLYNEPVMMYTIVVDNVNISRNSWISVYRNASAGTFEPGCSYFGNEANGTLTTSFGSYFGVMKLEDICKKEIATPLGGGSWRYMWYIANNYLDAYNKHKMFGNSKYVTWMTKCNAYDYQNWHSLFEFGNITGFTATPIWWNNVNQSIATRCYTSIQQGGWWYLNGNTVTTTGTRAYRGDGGSSGQAGNAGFILILPPTT